MVAISRLLARQHLDISLSIVIFNLGSAVAVGYKRKGLGF